MKQWYIVYSKINCEKKVAAALSKKKIINYCPLLNNNLHSGNKSSTVPLFPSYIFVHLEQDELQKVLQISGVINFIYWLGKPVTIKDVEIEVIQRFIAEHKKVSLERIDINRNDCIQILNSQENKSTLLRVPPMEVVKLMLPSIGFALTGERQKATIKVVFEETIAV